MIETPHVTDVEVSRALNALVCTLNDQRHERVDVGRWQAIVTGALGGEPRILVSDPAGRSDAATLTDREGSRLASVWREESRWLGRRDGALLTGAYVPSA